MRVKRGIMSHKRRTNLLKANKGYRMTKRRNMQVATEAHLHAGEYAFAGRKLKKRNFRTLWITRISEAVKLKNLSYSVFMSKLKAANIDIDRKMLANIVVEDPAVFDEIVEKVRSVN